MDPNATVAELDTNDADLSDGQITRAQHRARRSALLDALRHWRAMDGFPPKGGWPKGA